jgi:hypothetical protein
MVDSRCDGERRGVDIYDEAVSVVASIGEKALKPEWSVARDSMEWPPLGRDVEVGLWLIRD